MTTAADALRGWRFPDDFRFGVATAAHQVEGGNIHSDWWTFEQKPGVIRDGSRSGDACDHFHRYPDDMDLIKGLSLDSYRFSVEWARIEPEPGRFDTAALDHYGEMVAACRSRGLEPFLTLYHFTLPKWFSDGGGWEAPDSPERFAAYTRQVAHVLGDQVKFWTTINEPVVYMVHGYILADWPPMVGNFRRMIKAGRNLVRAHFQAARVLRETVPEAQIGLAKHLRVFEPDRPKHTLDAWATFAQEYPFNWTFLECLETGRFVPPLGSKDRIREAMPSQDYLGVNYYSRDRIRFNPLRPGQFFGDRLVTTGAACNDMGWEIFPEGLHRLLKEAHERYGKPILILENGTADATDTHRPAFLVQHLAMIARAMQEGVPVRGYFHWSLLDNFEWSEGYTPRFGLIEVDYATQERKPRPSAGLYARIAGTRELPEVGLEPIPRPTIVLSR